MAKVKEQASLKRVLRGLEEYDIFVEIDWATGEVLGVGSSKKVFRTKVHVNP
ncbi:MAG: hypothetical protein NWE96_08260 [Candidatus Bathyarchaeota archaeon]|nr:hypothetical protein [Candidatus Bathyarchaeota archaeon]